MKKQNRFTVAIAALAALVALLTGCSTRSVITEFDVNGNITRQTVTEKDPFDKIVESTKDKTIIMWSDGWAGYFSISVATIENPTPTFKVFAGKVSRGYISLLPEQKEIDKISEVIKATSSNLYIDQTGIKSSRGVNKK